VHYPGSEEEFSRNLMMIHAVQYIYLDNYGGIWQRAVAVLFGSTIPKIDEDTD
jgi:hypothetical protein